jgi:hypothetical protein
MTRRRLGDTTLVRRSLGFHENRSSSGFVTLTNTGVRGVCGSTPDGECLADRNRHVARSFCQSRDFAPGGCFADRAAGFDPASQLDTLARLLATCLQQ